MKFFVLRISKLYRCSHQFVNDETIDLKLRIYFYNMIVLNLNLNLIFNSTVN